MKKGDQMKIRIAILCLLFSSVFSLEFSLLLKYSNAQTEYYISENGTDSSDCTLGSRENPWRSLVFQYENECIKPGATVYFRPGVYSSDSDVFNGRINVSGEENNPITIKAEHVNGVKWPVKFIGSYIISDAKYVVIDGIDFERTVKNQDILAIGASHVVIQNCKIHGSESDYNKFFSSKGDCLKIAGGMKIVEDIKILNNEIYYCGEDAIDITGRKKILIKNNSIHDSWIIQIKGGAEEITVEENDIYHMHYGISGNGMDCSKDNIYCGNPVLQTLPVEERYEAKNVIIKNNKIRNVYSGRAIDFSGWKNSSIISNIITNENNSGEYVLSTRNNVGSVFFDDLARNYCQRNPNECREIKKQGELFCWKIRSKSRNIDISDNYIENKKSLMIKIEPDSIAHPETIFIDKNEFVVEDGGPKFLFEKKIYRSIKKMPINHNKKLRLWVN